jgi:hypothetical protein
MMWMPDANLRSWVNFNFPGAISGDLIDETNAGVQAASMLDIQNQGVSDLTGISAFANATFLNCSNNPLTVIADGPPSLVFLLASNCAFTGVFQVPFGLADLSYLNISYNQITEVSLAMTYQLTTLNCAHNAITSIQGMFNVFYTLNTLDCSYNQLSSFPDGLTSVMVTVDISHNLFTALPSAGSSLTYLNASYNPITDVSNLYGAQYNFQVDLSHDLIDHIGSMPNADNIDLSYNPLTQGIDALPYQLHTLRINNTQMPCLPYLNNALVHLYSAGNSFTCLPNQPVGLVMNAADLGFAPAICGSNSPCYAPLPTLDVRVFLQGPFDFDNLNMRDDLRAQGLLPTSEPYTALGFVYSGAGWSDSLDTAIFDVTGNDAIVDWVVVDMFPAFEVVNTGNATHYSRPALLQRDGDVVGLDGSSPLVLNMPYGPYNTAVRHRNHLGVRNKVYNVFGAATNSVDFTDWYATACFGQAMHGDSLFDPNRQMWSGDVTFNHQLKYVGVGNDRDPILQAIGGNIPTAVVSGVYAQEDVNMDGKVKYTGIRNDRDALLQNIAGGAQPTAVRYQVAF